MCNPKCDELAIKLGTIHELLDACYVQGLPDLEAEHQILVDEFTRLSEEWKTQGVTQVARCLRHRDTRWYQG